MSQSLWTSVGALLLKAGSLYAEHAKNVIAALQLPAAQQHERLQGYLRSLTPAQFAGFKVAVEVAANAVANPLMAHALRTVVARAERFRDEPVSTALAVNLADVPPAEPPVLVEVPPAVEVPVEPELTYQDALDQMETLRVRCGGEVSAIADHDFEEILAGRSQRANAALDGYIEQAIASVGVALANHRANEAIAWGRYAEDRMAYMIAKARTGARDPRFVQRERELEGHLTFLQELLPAVRGWRSRHEAARAPQPVGSGYSDELLATLEAMRLGALESGELRADRAHASAEWMNEFRELVTAAREGTLDPSQTVAKAQAILAKRKRMIMDAGPAPASSFEGLASLLPHVQALKGTVVEVLAGVPRGEQTHRAYAELFGSISRLFTALREAQSEAQVVALESHEARPLALEAHRLALLPHLTVARPLWDCASISPDPSQVTFVGRAGLRRALQAALNAKGMRLPTLDDQLSYGQRRWSTLRSGFVCVFDLRGFDRLDPEGMRKFAGAAYEIGLAYALGKPMVVVASLGGSLPFDIAEKPLYCDDRYDPSPQELGAAIDRAIYSPPALPPGMSAAQGRADVRSLAAREGLLDVVDGMGWLKPETEHDPVALEAQARQVLYRKPGNLLLTPRWLSSAPARERTLFFVTPFAEAHRETRAQVKATCAALGTAYSDGQTVDDVMIIRRIWAGITAAELILADISGRNLNVMIELGMAHALGKRTIVVSHVSAMDRIEPRHLEKVEVIAYRTAHELSEIVATSLRGMGR